MSYAIKSQTPLMLGDNYILPLTSYDQIIMPDGSRWDGKSGVDDSFIGSGLQIANDGTLSVKVGEGLQISEDGTLSLAYANGDEVGY